MNVSFDFDGTFTRNDVQDFSRFCADRGFAVWIVTSRSAKGMHENYNKSLFELAESYKIPRERIVFMSHVLKKSFFKNNPDFAFHLDDDWIEIHEINNQGIVPGISCFGNVDWEQECFTALEN